MAWVWICFYLLAVILPLPALLLERPGAGRGPWTDFSLALGFLGLSMMGMQLLLTARFRRASLPFGIDVIYTFHRAVAWLAVGIVLAHPMILLVERQDRIAFLNPLAAPWPMTAGLISVVALVVLVASSALRKRLRIPYETWRVAHLALTVIVLGAALLHIAGVGGYARGPLVRASLAALALFWVALVLQVRLLKPWRMMLRPYRIDSVREERGDARTIVLRPDGHAGMSFLPGQFVWLSFRSTPFAMRAHPFSIASPESGDGAVTLTIKELGDFTRSLRDVSRGEAAWLDGPYGDFTIDRHEAPGYLFVAGGIGIVPVMCMLRALAGREDLRPLVLFYGNRRYERAVFREEIEALCERLSLEVIHVLEVPPEGWEGERGYVTRELMERHLPEGVGGWAGFVCGPTPMIVATERALRELGMPWGDVHSEIFDLV